MRDTWVFRTTAEECLKVPCPTCDALAQLPCVEDDGRERSSFHSTRHDHAWRCNQAKPVLTQEQWNQQRQDKSLARRLRAGLSNVRRDGW